MMKTFAKFSLAAAAVVFCAVPPLAGTIAPARASAAAGMSRQEVALTAPEQQEGSQFSVPKKRLSAREWARKGSEFLVSKDYPRAWVAFSNAIELNEGFLYLANKKAAMHMRYGNCDLANKELKRIEDLEGVIGHLHYQRGVALRQSGKVQEAVFDFDRAIGLDPKLSPAYLERGRAYQEMGDYRRAVDDYNLALKADPQNPAVYCERGSAYIKMEFFPLAMLDCDKAIRIDPKCANAYYARGISFQKTGNGEKGIQDFKTAAALGSKEAQDLLKAAGVQW